MRDRLKVIEWDWERGIERKISMRKWDEKNEGKEKRDEKEKEKKKRKRKRKRERMPNIFVVRAGGKIKTKFIAAATPLITPSILWALGQVQLQGELWQSQPKQSHPTKINSKLIASATFFAHEAFQMFKVANLITFTWTINF